MKPGTHARLKSLITDFAPPIVLRGASAVFASKPRVGDTNPQVGEKSAEWYDASFDACEHWSQHYTASEYYFLWSVIVDRIAMSDAGSILEIGCGTGQLASLIHDKVMCNYHGFDFSAKRVGAITTVLTSVRSAWNTRRQRILTSPSRIRTPFRQICSRRATTTQSCALNFWSTLRQIPLCWRRSALQPGFWAPCPISRSLRTCGTSRARMK